MIRRADAGRPRRPANLRLILGGLAAGALVLPFALAGIVGLVLSNSGREQSFLHYREVSIELQKAARIDSRGELVLLPGYSPPPKFELVLEGRDGAVLYSTSPLFKAGERPSFGAFSAAAAGEFSSPSFFTETLSFKGKPVGSYFAWLPESQTGMHPSVPFPAAGSLVLAALIIAVFLLGALVAAQLGRAVLKLEAAARRIAAGDFETVVSVRGIREIADLARAMDGMRSTLREDRDQRARFLAAVSHDLRTPLTSIGGYLEAVEDGLAADPGTLERYVRIMRGKTRLLETRIGGLIAFARMETEEWRMGFEATELHAFLEGLAREAREDAVLLGRRFEAALETLGDIRLSIDRGLLSRALENVISNAYRYSPDGGLVRMSASVVVAEALLDIDDQGPGIPLAEREIVFEPFYRGSAAGGASGAAAGEGTGLGLYIARSIVRGHGWTIEAGESPGGGGRIRIRMPLKLAPSGGKHEA